MKHPAFVKACPNCGNDLFAKQDEWGWYLICFNAQMDDRRIWGCLWTGEMEEMLAEMP